MQKDRLILLKAKQDQVFEKMALILGVLGSPVRLQMIHFLSQAPHSVEQLAEKIDQTVANTSMHLRKMLTSNILSVESQGQKRLYSLSHPSLLVFWEELQNFTQSKDVSLRLDVEQIYGEIDWPKNEEETKADYSLGNILLLDVRPDDEAPSGQMKVTNYLHIPSSKLKKNLHLIPKTKFILVFCRGRLCALSANSVAILRENGIQAYRLQESWFSLNRILHSGGTV